MVRVYVAWLLLALTTAATGSPPAPAGTKRSMEELQFGNQQNPPVSLLDDNALPGAFPSSETSEETVAKPESQEEQHQQEEDPLQVESQKDDELSTAVQPSQWPVSAGTQLHLYQPQWVVPTMYDEGTYPARRLQRSASSHRRPDPRKVPQVPLKVLRAGQRHKRDLRRYQRDLRRYQRDLRRYQRGLFSKATLDDLLREVDVAELLAMLERSPQMRQAGYGTVTYAPSPPRYAPQPKLFPDYDDDDDNDDDDDDDSDDDGISDNSMKLLRQNIRSSHLQNPGELCISLSIYRTLVSYVYPCV
ncbi:uncharacterized protein [Panulirus ornatus]|uniref:uncharacterized protein n=1 Tax=Panulirus ornatus TaxID=150431 RepID=UPI003A8978C2